MDAVSIEEANKIRVAMGMKPLPVPGKSESSGPIFKEQSKDGDNAGEEASTLESRHAQAGENWKKLHEEADAKAKLQARKETIKKEREKAQRFAHLEGKGLGDTDGQEDLDTKTWLLQQKKRQKKLEKRRKVQQEFEEREKERERQIRYTSADLAGVKVGHELGQFEEGTEQILTLKDVAVDNEDEGDELEAINLREREKLDEKLESKKRKRAYDPNEWDPENGEKTILGQYDEEIDGKKRKVFTLDGQGRTQEELDFAAQKSSAQPRAVKISLDILKDDAPMSDYIDPSNIKVRKPKKKKNKSSRKKARDDDDIFATIAEANGHADSMDLDFAGDGAAPVRKLLSQDDDLLGDEDLQAQLALQRRQALKNRKRVRPEDLARQLREESTPGIVTPGIATPGIAEPVEDAEEKPGLVIDETSEFVANLQKREPPRKPSEPRKSTPVVQAQAESPDAEGDTKMEEPYAAIDDDNEAREGDPSVTGEVTSTGLEEEPMIGLGLGDTVKLLRQRGLMDTDDHSDLNKQWRDRQRFLTAKRKAQEEAERRAREQRERDRKNGKFDHMSAREREAYAHQQNAQRDQHEARRTAEIFKREYKPNVELKYVDEFGRYMNQKEAFKHLSHQFHGKGSGKQKTEKRLKKIDQERKKEAESTLDSSQLTGMGSAANSTARKNRQAGVRLQ